jgi:hypothetical protein
MSCRSVTTILPESDGDVLLEFAMVLPVLLLLITGIFDFGFAFREYLLVTNAAREGARMAILPGYTDADVSARVKDYLTKAGGVRAAMIVDPIVTTGPPDSPPGATYTVKTVTAEVDHTFSLVAPFGSKYGTVALKAVSVMRVEVAAGAP